MARKPPERHHTAISSGEWAKDGSPLERTIELNVLAGQPVIVRASGESAAVNIGGLGNNLEISDSGGNSWTEEYVIPDADRSSQPLQASWTCIAKATGTITIKVTYSAGRTETNWAIRGISYENSEGFGSKAVHSVGETSENSASVELTTEKDNSVLDCHFNDWEAATGTIAWSAINGKTPTQVDTYQGGSDYTVLSAWYTDSGTAGSKKATVTVGGSQSLRDILGMIEVLGEDEGEPQELKPDEDLAATGWTETPLFSKLNDGSDATGVKATLAGEGSGETGSTGEKFPSEGTTTNEAPWSDNAWTSPGNVVSNNGVYASVTATTFDNGDQTGVLKAFKFDMSGVPAGAVIKGVRVKIEAKADSANVGIDLVQLLSTSRAKVGENKSNEAQRLTTADKVYEFGGPTDLWGNALTEAWVKDEDFGVAIGGHAYTANSEIFIDYVTVEVFWELPVPTETPVARVSLEAGTTPKSRTSHTLRLRAKKLSGSGTVVLRAALYESSNNRSGDLESAALTTELADLELPISKASAEAISSYSNLETRFWGYSPTGDKVEVEVVEVELEIPEGEEGGEGPEQQNLTLSTAASTSTATAALTGRTALTLSGAASTATAALALTAKTTLPLGTAASTASPSAALTAKTSMALEAVAATATASLAVTARAQIQASTAATATASLALTAQTTLPTLSATAASTASAALTAQTSLALSTATGASTASLSLGAEATLTLGTVPATSVATLALAARTTLALSAAPGTSSTAAALTARTTVALTAAATSSVLLELAGPRELPMETVAGASLAALQLTAKTSLPLSTVVAAASPTVALTAKTTLAATATATATASASLSLTARAAISATAAAQATAALVVETEAPITATATAASSASLALTAKTTIALSAAASTATATAALAAKTGLQLSTATANSGATAALTARAAVTATATATATAALALTAKTSLALTVTAVATATLAPTAKTTLSLSSAAATGLPTLALEAAEVISGPAVRAVGAVAAGTATINVQPPGTYKTGDLLITFIESAGPIANTEALTEPEIVQSGWAQLLTVKQGRTRLTIYWKIATSDASDEATVTDTGDHQQGRMLAVEKDTFDPLDPFEGEQTATVATGTSAEVLGGETTLPNDLILVAAAKHAPDLDGATEFSEWDSVEEAKVTERMDNTTSQGDGGALGLASWTKPGKGGWGATKVTAVTSAEWALAAFAVRSLPQPNAIEVHSSPKSNGSLTLKVRQGLSATVTAVSAATLALKARTTIPLGASAATSSATAALHLKTDLSASASGGTSTATATVSVRPGPGRYLRYEGEWRRLNT